MHSVYVSACVCVCVDVRVCVGICVRGWYIYTSTGVCYRDQDKRLRLTETLIKALSNSSPALSSHRPSEGEGARDNGGGGRCAAGVLPPAALRSSVDFAGED